MKKIMLLTAFVYISSFTQSYAHCQIPCGIYHDELRVQLMKEHVTTIEKSINSIKSLSGKSDAESAHKLARWVTNKEEHAEKIQKIATEYFMFQRVKIAPEGDKNKNEMTKNLMVSLHKIVVYAMKSKQSLSSENVSNLLKSIQDFEKLYFEGKKHKH